MSSPGTSSAGATTSACGPRTPASTSTTRPHSAASCSESAPMDLGHSRRRAWICDFSSDFTCQAVTWAEYSQESTQSCDGRFAAIWSTFDLGTIYLAQNNTQHLHDRDQGQRVLAESGETQYQNLLYVLPGDGSCGSQSCAISTISLPIMFNHCDAMRRRMRAIQVTSLAAGYDRRDAVSRRRAERRRRTDLQRQQPVVRHSSPARSGGWRRI